MSDSLQPHEVQHAKPPCPSPTPRVHSDSLPSSQWCHPTISSSVVSFSSCCQSFPASGSFQMGDHRMINTWSVNDQPRDHCMRRQVVSSWSATGSVRAQSHDQRLSVTDHCLINPWSVPDQTRHQCMRSHLIRAHPPLAWPFPAASEKYIPRWGSSGSLSRRPSPSSENFILSEKVPGKQCLRSALDENNEIGFLRGEKGLLLTLTDYSQQPVFYLPYTNISNCIALYHWATGSS